MGKKKKTFRSEQAQRQTAGDIMVLLLIKCVTSHFYRRYTYGFAGSSCICVPWCVRDWNLNDVQDMRTWHGLTVRFVAQGFLACLVVSRGGREKSANRKKFQSRKQYTVPIRPPATRNNDYISQRHASTRNPHAPRATQIVLSPFRHTDNDDERPNVPNGKFLFGSLYENSEPAGVNLRCCTGRTCTRGANGEGTQ